MTNILSTLKELFAQESSIWEKEILFEIYGVFIEGPEKENFLKEDDLHLEKKDFCVKLFFKNIEVALFSYDIRGIFVMVMEKKKGGSLKNLLQHKDVFAPDCWKVWQICELPHANLYRRY